MRRGLTERSDAFKAYVDLEARARVFGVYGIGIGLGTAFEQGRLEVEEDWCTRSWCFLEHEHSSQ